MCLRTMKAIAFFFDFFLVSDSAYVSPWGARKTQKQASLSVIIVHEHPSSFMQHHSHHPVSCCMLRCKNYNMYIHTTQLKSFVPMSFADRATYTCSSMHALSFFALLSKHAKAHKVTHLHQREGELDVR